MSAIDYFMGHPGLMLLFKMELRIMNNEEELQELVKKMVDNFAALNENESSAESEKDLRELLKQSKGLGLIM